MTHAPPPQLSVADARAAILRHTSALPTEQVTLWEADRRTLAEPLTAKRTQPPFAVSAMDGFAVRAGDVASLPAHLELIGEAAAGHGFEGTVGPGQAVRIFTGAPVPGGADAIVIQENTRHDRCSVTVTEGTPEAGHIRPAGFDFSEGDTLMSAPRVLNSRDVTLAAAMGHASLPVVIRPRVALIATGDELVLPGEPVGPDQIVCSNPFGIAAIASSAGAVPEFVGIAPDNRAALTAKIEAAAGADILVAIGGASVGDHDLVGPVLEDLGLSLDFWRIGMRPGKPLMYGRLGNAHVLGVPGNPVSSMICARLFLVPLIRTLLGQSGAADLPIDAIAGADMTANGPREHYMRATSKISSDGARRVTPVRSQDSSLLSPLAEADCLIVRPPGDSAKKMGEPVKVLPLDF